MSISTDSGRSFKHVIVPELVTDARYAAFPSDNVWYIAAGQFPSNEGRHTEFKNADGTYRTSDFGAPQTPGYVAQIVKVRERAKL